MSAQYDLGIFFSDQELAHFDSPPLPEPPQHPSGPSLSRFTESSESRHSSPRQQRRGIRTAPAQQHAAAHELYEQPQLVVPRLRPSEAAQRKPAGQRLEPLASVFANQSLCAPIFSQAEGFGVGISTFGGTTGNAFGDYVRRLPSVSYGARSFQGPQPPFISMMEAPPTHCFPSMFRGGGGGGMPSQMQMSGVALSRVGPYSLMAPTSTQEQSGAVPPQFRSAAYQLPSQAHGGSEVAVFSPLSLPSVSVSRELPASMGPTGVEARRGIHVTENPPRAASGTKGTRSLSKTRAKAGKVSRKSSPAGGVSPKKPRKVTAGTLNPSQRMSGARLGTTPAATDRVNVPKALHAHTTNNKSGELSSTSEGSLQIPVSGRNSKNCGELFWPLTTEFEEQDREKMRQDLMHARRMVPSVWRHLLRDPMAKKAARMRPSYIVEGQENGDDDDDDDDDSDRDQWGGLPVKRRSLNELLGSNRSSAVGSRRRSSGAAGAGDSDHNASARPKAGAKVEESHAGTSPSLQMDGTNPRFFIHFTPTHSVPALQPNMLGPKQSSFRPTIASIATSPFRWALEDATFVDSPRNSLGESIFDCE